MAVFTRVNGGAKVGQFFGRDINFVLVNLTGIQTNYTNVDSTYEKVVRALQMYGTMSIAGLPSGGNAIFAMEGLQTGATQLDAGTLENAIDAATGGSSTVTVYGISTAPGVGISGNGFA